MKLSDLTERDDVGSVEISGLSADSRSVKPGYLFAALPGTAANGANFIDDAIKHGAVAVLARPGTPVTDPNVSLVEDENPRRRLALIAARFFPRQPANIAAVTGTNGKTSVVNFTCQLWSALGEKAASIGTLGVDAPGPNLDVSLTTPEPVTLHQTLNRLADEGVDHLAIEASSHGLDQSRLDGVRVKAAGFTNRSHDHLDYHESPETYLAAKARLFSEVMAPDGTAVLNTDIPEFSELRSACRKRGQRVLSYGVSQADLGIARLTTGADGLAFELRYEGRTHAVRLPLFGAFQASNVVCALGLVLATGSEINAALAALAGLKGVPGRMERIGALSNGAQVFVDYAHTPDALRHALGALRAHAAGRVVVVFGCGGDRDREKRPTMGRIAATLADDVFVTDDNPRGESPSAIRAEIIVGCPHASEIGDRAEAIYRGVADLDANDMLLIAGKGHETGQITGGKVRAFDDREVARQALANQAEVL